MTRGALRVVGSEDFDREISEETARALEKVSAELDGALGSRYTIKQVYDGLVEAGIAPEIAQATTYYLVEQIKDPFSVQEKIVGYIKRNDMLKVLGDSLEKKVKMPTKLRNDILIEEGRVHYVAQVWGLHFNCDSIEGGASLNRYNASKKNVKRPSFCSDWPFLKLINKEKTKFNKIWGLRAGLYDHYNFIRWGNISDEYRKRLLADAANQGISLSPQLMDAAFDPIDEAISEIYKKFFRETEKK